MLTLRLSARHSTSVQLMAQEASLSIASSALMELCSSSNILSVTGGSMWTAPLHRTSGLSMRRWQLRDRLTLLLELQVVSMLGVREELVEEQEDVEEVPVDHKVQPPLQEGHTHLLQEALVLTAGMEHLEDLEELLVDMQGILERLNW